MVQFEFSAGGVVFKRKSSWDGGRLNASEAMTPPRWTEDQIKILLCQHSQHHGWVFPKGFIGDKKENEGKEETALREVKEETGVTAKILKPLTPVTYWYAMDGEKRKKTVYYYLMEYLSGDITKHDWEMENVEWLSVEEVEKRLTYESDREVWKEAREKIRNSNIETRNKYK